MLAGQKQTEELSVIDSYTFIWSMIWIWMCTTGAVISCSHNETSQCINTQLLIVVIWEMSSVCTDPTLWSQKQWHSMTELLYDSMLCGRPLSSSSSMNWFIRTCPPNKFKTAMEIHDTSQSCDGNMSSGLSSLLRWWLFNSEEKMLLSFIWLVKIFLSVNNTSQSLFTWDMKRKINVLWKPCW